MTVIAAKVEDDYIEMSCDLQTSRGRHKKNTGYNDKIIKGQDFIVGISGSALIKPLMTVFAKNHPVGEGNDQRIIEWCFEFLDFCKKKTDSWDQSGQLLLAHSSGLYCIHQWLPLEVKDFCAIGSGFEHAEAAMYLGHSTRDAVDVGINMAYGCGGAIVTERLYLEK